MSSRIEVAPLQNAHLKVRQSLSIIEYFAVVLEGNGLYLGTCRVKLDKLMLQQAQFYFNLGSQLSALLRAVELEEFVKSVDVLLKKKNLGSNPLASNIEMEAVYVLQTLYDLLRIIYRRFYLVQDDATAETILRIDARIRKLLFVPFFKEVDQVGQAELQRVLKIE